MTQTQRECPAEGKGKIIVNCGSRKKSVGLEKSTPFTPSTQVKIAPQLCSTLLKFQPITEIYGVWPQTCFASAGHDET